ncbi:MAG TPA: glycosyltransferase family 4 protein [Terriglobales bacterium]|nr:glycosyltransferase family 4 protein [Terriglobales bacterium]
MPKRRGQQIRVLMVLENCSYLRDARVQKEAAALTEAGYGVSVICPAHHNEPSREVLGAVCIYRFRLWQATRGIVGYLAEFIYAMLAISTLSFVVLLREGFDILHVANPPDCMVPVLSTYKLLGKVIIYDQHDLCPELYAAKFYPPNRFVSKVLMWLERSSYGLADHVIVTNESYKDVAIQRGLVAESKITVVRNGPALRDLSIENIDPELRGKSPNIIAFAGVIGYQDHLDHLCRALHDLRHRLAREDFYCVVIGDGDALPEIKALTRELGLESNIWFTGWVSDPDLYSRYIFNADICVVPDPCNDYNDRSTFVKVMEYMAAGKPIVAYDLCETRRSAEAAAEYARPNDVQDFAAKLARLMDDPGLRRSMGEIGLRRVQERLAWRHSVPNLLTAYEKTISSHTAYSLTSSADARGWRAM